MIFSDSHFRLHYFYFVKYSLNVVKTVTFETKTLLKFRDRDFIKNSKTETRDLNFKDKIRNFKICAFFQNYSKNYCHHFKVHFFQISGIFPTCYGCSSPAKTTEKKLVELQKFY